MKTLMILATNWMIAIAFLLSITGCGGEQNVSPTNLTSLSPRTNSNLSVTLTPDNSTKELLDKLEAIKNESTLVEEIDKLDSENINSRTAGKVTLPPPNTLPLQIDDIIEEINNLPDEVFKHKAARKILIIRIEVVKLAALFGRNKLAKLLTELTILRAIDGCYGGNKYDDLIITCDAQAIIYPAVVCLVESLEHGGFAALTINPAGPLTLEVGDTQQFSVSEAKYTDGADALTCIVQKVIWDSSVPSIGTISVVGVFTALSLGETNITATLWSIVSNTVMVNVEAPGPSVVSTGADIYSTAWSNGRRPVRDSAGNLYLAYHKGSPSQIYVSLSVDNGNTWSDMGGTPIQTIAEHVQLYPSIAIDSQDNLHAVWQGYDSAYTPYYQIKYSKYSGGNWSVWTNIQPIQYYNQTYPSIAIDSQDNLHVVWQGNDNENIIFPQIKYSKYSVGSWSTWSNIQPIVGYDQREATIAVDSLDNLHVLWSGLSVDIGEYQIKYSKYSGGSWTQWNNIQPITGGYTQRTPVIVIDSQDNLHVVWRGRDSVNISHSQIKYSKYSGGNWSSWININVISGYDHGEPTAAIDSQDKVHVLWMGYDPGSPSYFQIKYSSCSSNCTDPVSWSSWVNKTSAANANQFFPSLRWARWNNNGGTLNWCWVDGTTVMFDKDTTVTMGE